MSSSTPEFPADLREKERRLLGFIEGHVHDAKEAADAAKKEQERLGDKLMLASGGSIALLATWHLSQATAVSTSDIVGPIVLLAVSFVISAAGLWSRIHANLRLSQHVLALASDLDRMKREADAQFQQGTIGKVPSPTPSALPPFPERWISALDVLLIVGFALFLAGVTWAGFNVLD
ncbi:MAG: hypothetical protein ABI790_18050 [Betaproteobacteria bacterium]